MANSESREKRRKYYCTFNDAWKSSFDWLQKKSEYEAECRDCRQTFSIKFEGIGAVNVHANSAKHQRLEKQRRQNAVLTSFFRKPNSKEDDLITAAEITATFHGVKHHLSYNSQDCTNKLASVMFSDSAIAKQIRCGRTKASSIVENVLAPLAQERLIQELQEAKFFSVATDSSNVGNLKMYPLVVQYFAKEEGIKIGLLDFYEDANETSESISRQIEKVVHKNNLDFANISSFAADNASVNFGKNVSVYEKLKAHVPNLIKANCKCHILHNCVKYGMKSFSFDMELLVLKVFSEFSAYAKRTKELKSFFNFVS